MPPLQRTCSFEKYCHKPICRHCQKQGHTKKNCKQFKADTEVFTAQSSSKRPYTPSGDSSARHHENITRANAASTDNHLTSQGD